MQFTLRWLLRPVGLFLPNLNLHRLLGLRWWILALQFHIVINATPIIFVWNLKHMLCFVNVWEVLAVILCPPCKWTKYFETIYFPKCGGLYVYNLFSKMRNLNFIIHINWLICSYVIEIILLISQIKFNWFHWPNMAWHQIHVYVT